MEQLLIDIIRNYISNQREKEPGGIDANKFVYFPYSEVVYEISISGDTATIHAEGLESALIPLRDLDHLETKKVIAELTVLEKTWPRKLARFDLLEEENLKIRKGGGELSKEDQGKLSDNKKELDYIVMWLDEERQPMKDLPGEAREMLRENHPNIEKVFVCAVDDPATGNVALVVAKETNKTVRLTLSEEIKEVLRELSLL